jgi:hypothetical protein
MANIAAEKIKEKIEDDVALEVNGVLYTQSDAVGKGGGIMFVIFFSPDFLNNNLYS